MSLSGIDIFWIIIIIISVILILIGLALILVKRSFPWYVWTLIILGLIGGSLGLIFLLVL